MYGSDVLPRDFPLWQAVSVSLCWAVEGTERLLGETEVNELVSGLIRSFMMSRSSHHVLTAVCRRSKHPRRGHAAWIFTFG
jgi:hypothetical protein